MIHPAQMAARANRPASAAEVAAMVKTLRNSQEKAERRDNFARLMAQDRSLVVEQFKLYAPLPEFQVDPLAQQIIHDAPEHESFDNAIVLQCSAKFIPQTDDLIRDLFDTGNAENARIVVFASDDGAWQHYRDREEVLTVRCTLITPPRAWMKMAVWTVAGFIKAQRFITLESDMAVRGSLAPVWQTLEHADERTVYGVKGHFLDHHISLGKVIEHHGNNPSTLGFVTGQDSQKAEHTNFLFNGGLFAGDRQAFADMEAKLRGYFPFSLLACQGWPLDHGDELVTYLAVNELGFSGFLHPSFNHQIFISADTGKITGWNPAFTQTGVKFFCEDRESVVLHFVGKAKDEWLPRYRRLVKADHRDVPQWVLDAPAFYSAQELRTHVFSEGLKLDGLLLEFGVCHGHTIRELAAQTERTIWGFDSWQGFKETWRPGFEKGHFACDVPEVPKNVRLVSGYFEDSLLPWLVTHPEPVAFAHLDADLYSSTRTVLIGIAGRLKRGSVLLFDEFFGYEGWQWHEAKAFQELVEWHGLKFECIGWNPEGQQVAVRIL